MDLRQLELLLAVVEHSSMTRAAEKMCLSPGAISQQIHSLAAELRTELFTRSGKRLIPTPEALRLVEHARKIIREIRQVEREFENDPETDPRPFHFASGPTTLIYRLGGPLRLLRKKYSRAEIYVTVAPTEEIVAGLLDRRFDLGVISLPIGDESLHIVPLYEEELLILRPCLKRVAAKNVGGIRPAELADAPFLLYPKKSNMRGMIDRFFAELGLNPRVTMEADDTEAIKRLVESGFGCSILPQYALREPKRFFETFRVVGHRLARTQALAMVGTEYPRALTVSIARFLEASLAAK